MSPGFQNQNQPNTMIAPIPSYITEVQNFYLPRPDHHTRRSIYSATTANPWARSRFHQPRRGGHSSFNSRRPKPFPGSSTYRRRPQFGVSNRQSYRHEDHSDHNQQPRQVQTNNVSQTNVLQTNNVARGNIQTNGISSSNQNTSLNGSSSSLLQDPHETESASTEELLRLWVPLLCTSTDLSNWVKTLEQSLQDSGLPLMANYEIKEEMINKKSIWHGWLAINGVLIVSGISDKKNGVKNLVYEAAVLNLRNGQLENILKGEIIKINMQQPKLISKKNLQMKLEGLVRVVKMLKPEELKLHTKCLNEAFKNSKPELRHYFNVEEVKEDTGLQYKYELYVEDLLFATSMATKKKEAKNQVCIIAFRILSTWASQKIADQLLHGMEEQSSILTEATNQYYRESMLAQHPEYEKIALFNCLISKVLMKCSEKLKENKEVTADDCLRTSIVEIVDKICLELKLKCTVVYFKETVDKKEMKTCKVFIGDRLMASGSASGKPGKSQQQAYIQIFQVFQYTNGRHIVDTFPIEENLEEGPNVIGVKVKGYTENEDSIANQLKKVKPAPETPQTRDLVMPEKERKLPQDSRLSAPDTAHQTSRQMEIEPVADTESKPHLRHQEVAVQTSLEQSLSVTYQPKPLDEGFIVFILSFLDILYAFSRYLVPRDSKLLFSFVALSFTFFYFVLFSRNVLIEI